jgi:hypothetical protein
MATQSVDRRTVIIPALDEANSVVAAGGAVVIRPAHITGSEAGAQNLAPEGRR